MTIAEVLADAKERMAKAVEVAKDDFATVTAGRANPALFQKVLVDYYGTPTPLVQLATWQMQFLSASGTAPSSMIVFDSVASACTIAGRRAMIRPLLAMKPIRFLKTAKAGCRSPNCSSASG